MNQCVFYFCFTVRKYLKLESKLQVSSIWGLSWGTIVCSVFWRIYGPPICFRFYLTCCQQSWYGTRTYGMKAFLKNSLCKIVTLSHVVTKFDVINSRLHCTYLLLLMYFSSTSKFNKYAIKNELQVVMSSRFLKIN